MLINSFPLITNNQYNIRKKPVCPRVSQGVDTVSFSGHSQTERCLKSGFKVLVKQTAFFREPETMEFACNHLSENFGDEKVIRIVSGGCSTGEEGVSLSMMLYALRNKVRILGIDLGKDSIKQANSRRYVFEVPKKNINILDHFVSEEASPYTDAFLISDTAKGLNARQKAQKSLFNEFFEPTGEVIKTPFFEELAVAREKRYGGIPLEIDRKAYKLKEGMAENCKFVQGNIKDIDKLTSGEKQHAIFFRNSLYHLTTKDVTSLKRVPKKDSEQIMRDLFQKFHDCLVSKGIVVFGEKEATQLSYTKNVLGKDNEEVKLSELKKVAKVMQELGFEPLNETADHPANVWQKI